MVTLAEDRLCRVCDIEGCGKPHVAHGLCRMHYARWYEHGDPLMLREQQFGEDNPAWKGANLSISGLHDRLERERGKANRCIIFQCNTGCTIFDWANISHEYKDTGDFMPMCRAHHRQYDAESYRGERSANAKLTWDLAEEIRARYDHGNGNVLQQELADEYNVSVTTISGVVRNEIWKVA